MNNVNKFLFLLLVPVLLTGQERLVKQGNEAYNTYSFKPAQDIYQWVLDKGYVSAEVLKKLGDTHYYNAEYTEASILYERLMSEYPDEADATAVFRYAQSLKSIRDYEGADRAMEEFYARTGRQGPSAGGSEPGKYRDDIGKISGRYTLKSFDHN